MGITMNEIKESILGMQITLLGTLLTIALLDSELFWIGFVPVILGSYIVFSRVIDY